MAKIEKQKKNDKKKPPPTFPKPFCRVFFFGQLTKSVVVFPSFWPKQTKTRQNMPREMTP
jgi:hypothetical protein